jgi:chitinase
MMRARAALLIPLLLSASAVTSCRSATDLAPADDAYRIIAYVRGRAEIHRIGAQKLTHINYAFATVSPEGDVVLEDPDSPAHLAQIQALKAKNPSLRVLVSVGGWGADNFSDAALTQESRYRFATSAIEMVKKYGLDGVDLDWEYPGQAGPGIKFRAEDKVNFTALLRELRAHLDWLSYQRGRWGRDPYLLTIASAAGNYFKHTEMDVLHEYLDFINIMTYDMVGSWAPATGHHAALFGRSGDDPGPSTESYVRQHLEAGIPARKLVVGVPFYARAFAEVDPADDGLFQKYGRYATEYSGSVLSRDLVGKQGFTRRWDDVAKAPFLWNPETRTFITYDDAESLKLKTDFVKRLGLGGVMYWEHSHDPEETLLDVLYEDLR